MLVPSFSDTTFVPSILLIN